jgi:asparagine synthase (glutamine-hydrolysing)
VLSGDGGDEVFGGYTWYDAFLDPPRVPAWRRLARRLRSRGEDRHAAYFRWMGFLNARAQADLLPGAPDFDHLSLFRRFRDPDLPDITSLQLLDLHTFLVDDVLTKVDRASMACGVEVRVPLLDHELVEAAFSIDHRVLRAGGERKSLLKAAVRGWVPPELLTTRKKGFGMPLAAWMGRGLHECAERVLVGGSLVGRGLLDGDGLGRLLAERRARPTWLLLAAELWARHWLEGEEPASAALLARNEVS